jgi:hypothetical protein
MAITIKVKKGVPYTMDASDTSTFEEWFKKVDAYTVRYTGISIHDLPDAPYDRWFDSRVRPIRAANKALKLAQSDE